MSPKSFTLLTGPWLEYGSCRIRSTNTRQDPWPGDITDVQMKLMIVVGARPNFMKAAPILRAISTHNECIQDGSRYLQPLLVHTGQHYDAVMSDAFFVDLNL